jgi:hypothetical protein
MGRPSDPDPLARRRAGLLQGVSPRPAAAARQRANLLKGKPISTGDNSEQALAPLRERALEIERERYAGLLDPDDGRLHSLADRKSRVASGTAWLDMRGEEDGLGVVRDRKGNVWPVVDRLDKWRAGIDKIEAEIRQELREREVNPAPALAEIESDIIARRALPAPDVEVDEDHDDGD